MKYASIDDIEGYLLINIDEGFYNQVNAWIEGVSRNMDAVANRTLVAPDIGSGEDYEEMYYDGNNKGFLTIDDCQEIVSIQEGDEFGDNLVEIMESDFITYPKKTPFRKIIKKSGTFDRGIQNIRVEGRFGYFDEVPDDIRLACAIIVSGIINSYNRGPQSVSSEKYIDYSVTYKDDVGWNDYQNALSVAERYKKIDF